MRWIDAHHIHHWANGGETKPSNLVSLCRFHHRAVHEGRVRVVRCELPVHRSEAGCSATSAHHGQRRTDNGSWGGSIRFIMPNGQSFDSVAPDHVHPFDWTELPAEHAQRGLFIDTRTAGTRWSGESMDYGLAVEVLLDQSRRARTNDVARPVAI
jgi:HNH endonuclease